MTKEKNKKMIYSSVVLLKSELEILKGLGFNTVQEFVLASINNIKNHQEKEKEVVIGGKNDK